MTQSDAPDIYADPLPHAMKSLRAKSDEIARLKAVNAELVAALHDALFYAVRRNLIPDAKLLKARAAIAKAKGYKLTGREPTQEMMKAGALAAGIGCELLKAAHAMHDAAPGVGKP